MGHNVTMEKNCGITYDALRPHRFNNNNDDDGDDNIQDLCHSLRDTFSPIASHQAWAYPKVVDHTKDMETLYKMMHESKKKYYFQFDPDPMFDLMNYVAELSTFTWRPEGVWNIIQCEENDKL